MADECTDVANKEQFNICIRWINQNLEGHEYFIGLYGHNLRQYHVHAYQEYPFKDESQCVKLPRTVL